MLLAWLSQAWHRVEFAAEAGGARQFAWLAALGAACG